MYKKTGPNSMEGLHPKSTSPNVFQAASLHIGCYAEQHVVCLHRTLDVINGTCHFQSLFGGMDTRSRTESHVSVFKERVRLPSNCFQTSVTRAIIIIITLRIAYIVQLTLYSKVTV